MDNFIIGDAALAFAAERNFLHLGDIFPHINSHPIYRIAMMQLEAVVERITEGKV